MRGENTTRAASIPVPLSTVIGLHDASGQTVGDTLLAFLRAKQALLVLDNCEHCLEAAATLAELLLRGPECDQVQILTTSRQALGVVGETAWRAPSMNVPDGGAAYGTDEIGASEGVRLFCQRAQSVLPGFVLHDRNASTVAQICRHLDGIPLAIDEARTLLEGIGGERAEMRRNAAAPPRSPSAHPVTAGPPEGSISVTAMERAKRCDQPALSVG